MNDLSKANELIRGALGLEESDPQGFVFYALEIESRLEQLEEANEHLREAWVKQKDLEIDNDRMNTTMKLNRQYAS